MNRTFNGVVVKEQPMGEKGKLLYVLTENEGIVTVYASGARNIHASYLRCVQLFAFSEFTVYDKNGKLTLTEATLIENFFNLRTDIVVLAAASYLSELCLIAAIPENEGIMKLYLNCLYSLSNRLSDVAMIKAVFEYRLCVIIGLAPDFSGCAVCGKEGNLFDIEEVMLFCAKCVHEANTENVIFLTEGTVKALNYLNNCPDGKILSFRIDDTDKICFYDFCESHLIREIDLKPKSLDFYKELVKE